MIKSGNVYSPSEIFTTDNKGVFQFEITMGVVVSSFRFICMSIDLSHYTLLIISVRG